MSEPEVAFLASRCRIRDELTAGQSTPRVQLGRNQLHRLVLRVWTDPSLILTPGAGDVSAAAGVHGSDRVRERCGDLSRLHRAKRSDTPGGCGDRPGPEVSHA